MTIQNISKPYDDELLYSWLARQARENVLSPGAFQEACLGRRPGNVHPVHYDVRELFGGFARHLPAGADIKDLYLSLTTFRFEAMAMTRGRQTKYINSVFCPKDRLTISYTVLFNTLKVCPECMREDTVAVGRPYYHRSHQLSGVCTCHKHNVPLLSYCGKQAQAEDFRPEDFCEIPISVPMESLMAYTGYAQALFEAGIDTDIIRVKEILRRRLMELKYTAADNYAWFLESLSIWEHKDLFSCLPDPPAYTLAKLISTQDVSMEELVTALMLIYPDPKDFITTAIGGEPVLEQYTCPACGHSYCSTPRAQRDGWGCPYCSERISETDRFKKLVEADGRYSLLTGFESLNRPVRIKNVPGGKEFSVKPAEFLFGDSDDKIIPEDIPGFSVTGNTANTITIRHDACGETSTLSRSMFLKYPVCGICGPFSAEGESFADEVKRTGEYTILKGYINPNSKVTLKHEKCGRVQAYRPSNFLNGQRCSFCNAPKPRSNASVQLERWNKMYRLLIEYKKAKGDAYIPVNDDYKGTHLGRWCQVQRMKWRAGGLPQEQASLLENIGFSLSPTDEEWERRLSLYRMYAAESGTALINTDTDFDGEHIGAWARSQRTLYKSGQLSPVRAGKLLELDPDMLDFSALEWNRHYEAYTKYISETGTTHIAKETDYDGLCLGGWAARQRALYRDGKLPRDREERLLTLDPNVFDAGYADWEKNFKAYEKYVSQPGFPAVTKNTEFEGKLIGKWLNNQRTAYKSGKLPQKRAEKLLAIDPGVFFPGDAAWEHGVALYRDYVKEHGRIYSGIGGTELGRWLKNQRDYYRRGILRDDRAQMMLETDPEVFSTHESEWDDHFESFVRYVSQNGKCWIPRTLKFEGWRLGLWVSNQKQNYKRGELPPERTRRLLEVNPAVFDAAEPEWEAQFEAYKRYISQTGSPKASRGTEFEGRHIGKWLSRQRQLFLDGKLKKYREELLRKLYPDLFRKRK